MCFLVECGIRGGHCELEFRRVLVRSGVAFEVFDIAAARAPASAQCDAGTQQYGIRSSTKSWTVYVTDRNYRQVLALVANGTPFTALVHAPAIPVLATTDAFATIAPIGPTQIGRAHV